MSGNSSTNSIATASLAVVVSALTITTNADPILACKQCSFNNGNQGAVRSNQGAVRSAPSAPSINNRAIDRALRGARSGGSSRFGIDTSRLSGGSKAAKRTLKKKLRIRKAKKKVLRKKNRKVIARKKIKIKVKKPTTLNPRAVATLKPKPATKTPQQPYNEFREDAGATKVTGVFVTVSATGIGGNNLTAQLIAQSQFNGGLPVNPEIRDNAKVNFGGLDIAQNLTAVAEIGGVDFGGFHVPEPETNGPDTEGMGPNADPANAQPGRLGYTVSFDPESKETTRSGGTQGIMISNMEPAAGRGRNRPQGDSGAPNSGAKVQGPTKNPGPKKNPVLG